MSSINNISLIFNSYGDDGEARDLFRMEAVRRVREYSFLERTAAGG